MRDFRFKYNYAALIICAKILIGKINEFILVPFYDDIENAQYK